MRRVEERTSHRTGFLRGFHKGATVQRIHAPGGRTLFHSGSAPVVLEMRIVTDARRSMGGGKDIGTFSLGSSLPLLETGRRPGVLRTLPTAHLPHPAGGIRGSSGCRRRAPGTRSGRDRAAPRTAPGARSVPLAPATRRRSPPVTGAWAQTRSLGSRRGRLCQEVRLAAPPMTRQRTTGAVNLPPRPLCHPPTRGRGHLTGRLVPWWRRSRGGHRPGAPK